MDVAYEMLQVRRKVQVQIDRMSLEAEARVYGMTPIGYAMQIENIREERRKAEKERQAIGEGLARGFNKS